MVKWNMDEYARYDFLECFPEKNLLLLLYVDQMSYHSRTDHYKSVCRTNSEGRWRVLLLCEHMAYPCYPGSCYPGKNVYMLFFAEVQTNCKINDHAN